MNKKKNNAISLKKPLPKKEFSNAPGLKSQQKKPPQLQKVDQIQQPRKQPKQIYSQAKVKNRNPSKIPIKQKTQRPNHIENSPQAQNQKSLKEMVQMQIFTDPANIELTRKKQKLCEEQIKKQIEKTRQEISINSFNENDDSTNFHCTNNKLNNFSDSIEEIDKINNFNNRFFNDIPPISEEPFIADLSPGSLFDKSTVKTPPPGFSIRKRFNLSKMIPTFPDQETNLTDTRLDSASEVVYPDGRRVFYNGNNGNEC